MSDSVVKFLSPESVEFSLYLPEDISKLSVVQVRIPVSFNALGLPNIGGLYDPAMGPLSTRSGTCPTCHRVYASCPGHFGHIELPLPVYNAMFLKTIYSILRLACLECYTIQVPGNFRKLFITQLQLLDAGRVVEAQELAIQLSVLDTPSSDPIEEAAKTVFSEESINKYLSEILANSESLPIEESKNIEVLRANLLSFAKERFVPSKTCCDCKVPISKITLVHNKLMTTINTVEKDATDKVLYRGEPTFITPTEARNHLRALWVKYSDFIAALAPVLRNIKREHPTDAFFISTVPVCPPKVRPINYIREKMNEHPQTKIYMQILEQSIVARQIAHVACGGDVEAFGEESRMFYEGISGQTPTEKLHYAWQGLQTAIDNMINADLNNSGRVNVNNLAGLKQIISKKAGLIRMHMMGKRVNFAARSVITPDPNIGLDEIGIPEAFAKVLTYPTPVTPWNVSALRDAVLNGPNVHPGACSVQMESGQVIMMTAKNPNQREGWAKRLLTPTDNISKHDSSALLPPKIVRRHLRSGDVLLLNRQPTLHKPSIMAHRARILRGEKTLRLHYANCKAYNADFDGDEMNAHFPQNEVARSEAYNIVEVAKQYLVPKDGTPLSGLIQDHVVAGVRLTIRGRFFTRAEFCRLLHAALPTLGAKAVMLPPAMLKPRKLWSGKQLLSVVLLNCLPTGRPPPSLKDTAKIGAAAWLTHAARRWKAGGTPLTGVAMSEAEVILQDGELLCGVLDKKHFGSTPYGLAHCLYELYGGTSCMRFLSALGRLFTTFLQTEGFTLGVRDILVIDSADKKRKELLEKTRTTGAMAVVSALDLDISSTETEESHEMHGLPKAAELQLARIASGNNRVRASVDHAYKQFLDPITNAISSNCLPTGLLEPFPANNLQLMVQSGAKGSTVNTLQISCLLGQIELEGRRPPLLVSGKSLPSFCRFESAPRAGGFVADRFLTGIRPQEFFFHCMAGREGLIDTAVKTSRSGYLQRCLIKHLEGLLVAYDGTVRDSDGSVVQYAYGEDGLDVCRAQFFNEKKISILVNNYKAFNDEKSVKYLREACDMEEIGKARKEVRRWHRRQRRQSKSGECTRTEKNVVKKTPTPASVASRFLPCSSLEAFSERMEAILDSCLNSESDTVRDALLLRLSGAIVNPGEPVGVLAAQSIGEPSTQMTLNTFHFAGRGEMNVTLGIPRLREILMMASRNPKTPSMEVPMRANISKNAADKLRRKLRRSLLSEVLQDIQVTETLHCGRSRARKYVLRFLLLPSEILLSEHSVSNEQVLKHIEMKFFSELFWALRKCWRSSSSLLDSQENKTMRKRSGKGATEGEDVDPDVIAVDDDFGDGGPGDADVSRVTQAQSDDESDSDGGEAGGDEDAIQARYRKRRAQDCEYDESEEEEEQQREKTQEDEEKEEGQQREKTQEDEERDNDLKNGENENDETEELFSQQSPHKKKITFSANESATSILRKQRIENVLRKYQLVTSYTFDESNQQWCEVTLSLPLTFPRMDLTSLLRTVAEASVVSQTPGVRRAFLDSSASDGSLLLRTDGCNLTALFKYRSVLDLQRLYTNDVYAMSQTYGIEAARAVLVREVRDVFKAYGIAVDPRHLYLVADYMTFVGSYEPLSRRGMDSGSSPLQQMSFESSLGFLEAATLRGRHDNLRSPSARLMLGRPTIAGTGCFGLGHMLTV